MSTKCYSVLYFGLVMAFFTGAEIGSQFEKRRSPARDGYAFNPIYCPVRPEVNSFLRQLRVKRLARAISDQESLRISRSGNANVSAAYQCEVVWSLCKFIKLIKVLPT